jgi:hypothetical protein
LEAAPLVAGIDAATVGLTDQLKASGWRLAVELSTDRSPSELFRTGAVSHERRGR